MGTPCPEDDGIFGEETAFESLHVSVPQFLFGENPPQGPFHDAKHDDRSGVVQPDQRVALPPSEVADFVVVSVDDITRFAFDRFFNLPPEVFTTSRIPVLSPKQRVQFNVLDHKTRAELLRQGTFSRSAGSHDDNPRLRAKLGVKF